MSNAINVLRFSITGASDQYFNYIPLDKNASTKVNLNFVFYIEPHELTLMAKNSTNKIHLKVSVADHILTDKENDIPINQLKTGDFLSASFGFLIKDIETNGLNIAVSYIDDKKETSVFNTIVPAKESINE